MSKTDPLKPNPTLLIKLGSLVVHYEEFTSQDGHHFDKHVIEQLTEDDEVKLWFEEMNKLALLPIKR